MNPELPIGANHRHVFPREARRRRGRMASVFGVALALAALHGCAKCNDPAPAPAQLAPKAPAEPRPPVIEVHGHIGPNAYAHALELADENGVQRIVNLSGGNQARGLEPHLAAMKKHPGRIAVFFNVPWQFHRDPRFGTAIPAALERAVAAGYAGLKVPKALGLGVPDAKGGYLPVDDPSLDALWAKAGELGIPVSIHTGDPKAFFEPISPQNERWEELAEAPSWSFHDPKYPRRETLLAQRDNILARHRNTTFILVHFGNNPEDIDYVDRLLDANPNANVDVSARLAEIGRHDPEKVRALFLKHRDRILFGTDLGVHVRPTRAGGEELSLFLGSLTKGDPPTRTSVKNFYDRHWEFFERDHRDTGTIPHPVPIQGNWPIRPIHLPQEVLRAVYHDNAYRLIFAPHYARTGTVDPLSAKK
jgi:predicted TIM-barrel fold metal-dependent hydrolase